MAETWKMTKPEVYRSIFESGTSRKKKIVRVLEHDMQLGIP